MKDLTILRQFPFFDDLEEKELEKIAPLFTIKTYKKGEHVFWEEESGDELYLIKSGVVKIYRNELSREIILAVFRDGDYFGEMAVLENIKTRSASAKVLETTSLYVLKRSDFISLLHDNLHITMKMLESSLARLRQANELITDLTILNARKRMIRMLLRLSEQHGSLTSNGILINLKLTHQQLAHMTGTVRETVTKTLLELQDLHLIQVDKKKIIITDIDRLKKLFEV